MLKQFYSKPGSVKLLYSDTDSLVLSIVTKNLISDLHELRNTFDFSNIPQKHPLYDESKKSKLFHFKEEFGMLPILRFISLGSKVYSIQSVCCHEFKSHRNERCTNTNIDVKSLYGKEGINYKDKMVLKGISKNSKRNLTFEDYFQCLKTQNIIRTEEHRIQSRNQKITSSLVHKIALTSFCDKVLCLIVREVYNFRGVI